MAALLIGKAGVKPCVRGPLCHCLCRRAARCCCVDTAQVDKQLNGVKIFVCVCVCVLHLYYCMRSLWDGNGAQDGKKPQGQSLLCRAALTTSITRIASLNFCPGGASRRLTVLQTATAAAAQLLLAASEKRAVLPRLPTHLLMAMVCLPMDVVNKNRCFLGANTHPGFTWPFAPALLIWCIRLSPAEEWRDPS